MKRDHIAIALVLILAFALRFYNILIDGQIYEIREGTWCMSAWRIVEGEIPYRDFYHSQPPLSPFLLAVIFAVFGVGIIQARLFVIFFTTFTCFMIYLAGKRIDTRISLIGSLIFAVAPISILYGMYALNDFVAMTFCIVGYYFLTPVIMRDKIQGNISETEKKDLILAGIFVSLGVLVKTLLAPLFLAFIVILVMEGRICWHQNTEPSRKHLFFCLRIPGFYPNRFFAFLLDSW